MANKYLSGFLLFLVSCSIFIGSSSEAARLYTSDENIDSFALSKVFALLDSAVGAFKNGLAGASKMVRILSGDPSTLGPDQIQEVDEGFEHIRKATKEIKMVHSLLLGLILWPLGAFLCFPVSCFLACLVGGLVLCVVWVVVVVLLVVGLILFTPGLADGALPYHAATTAEMVTQTLSDICRESLNALERLSENGHKWPVTVALDAAQFIMEQIEDLGGQVQALINRAENVDETVREKLETIDNTVQTILTDIDQSLKQLRKGGQQTEKTEWFGSLFSFLKSETETHFQQSRSSLSESPNKKHKNGLRGRWYSPRSERSRQFEY